VVPGYDYAAHQNADDSDTPPDAMPNNALQ